MMDFIGMPHKDANSPKGGLQIIHQEGGRFSSDENESANVYANALQLVFHVLCVGILQLFHILRSSFLQSDSECKSGNL